MIKQENAKIITVFFVAIGFLTSFVTRVVFEIMAVYSGVIATIYGQEVVRHGLPIVAGLIIFLVLQLKESNRTWAHEVTVEVRKVIWPSRQATFGMTVLVCVILILSGFVLGLFDLASSAVVNFIVD